MQDLPMPDTVKDLPEPMLDMHNLWVRRHVMELGELLTNIHELLADVRTRVIDGMIVGHITNNST
jgi:hypothetical protein